MSNLQLLEEQILDCWNITSDIATLAESEVLPSDSAKKVLEGMKILYDIKFDVLFNTLSSLVRETAESNCVDTKQLV